VSEAEPRRYRPRRREELEPEQQALHDRIVGGPRAAQAAVVPITDAEGRLLGPFGPMTLAPAIGEAVQSVGAALRFAGTLDAATKEAAILLVGARRHCEYEWVLHVDAARAAGLDEGQLARLAEGELPSETGPADPDVLRLVIRLLDGGPISDTEYARAVDALGESALAEIVWLVGYYSMLALALRVFDPPIGSDRRAPWKTAE